MKIIKPNVQILNKIEGINILKRIEKTGRICYKSEKKITEKSCIPFVKQIIKNGHESVLEHISISVKFICDRGISHELVRHRLASFSQESTRYCNYSGDRFNGELTFILPIFYYNHFEKYSDLNHCIDTMTDEEKINANAFFIWKEHCELVEKNYNELTVVLKRPAQEARNILPNSLKTEIIMTANLREWRHVLKLRTSEKAHPQMQEIMNILLNELKSKVAVIFDDIIGE